MAIYAGLYLGFQIIGLFSALYLASRGTPAAQQVKIFPHVLSIMISIPIVGRCCNLW